MAKGKKAPGKKKSGDKFSGFDGVVDESKKDKVTEGMEKVDEKPVEEKPEVEVTNDVDEKEKEKVEEKVPEAPKVDEPDKKADVKLDEEPPKSDAKMVKVKFLKKCPRLWIINDYVEAEEEEIKFVKEEQAFILRKNKFIA